MKIIRLLMQGEGKAYAAAIEAVWQQIKKLDALATPPRKAVARQESQSGGVDVQ